VDIKELSQLNKKGGPTRQLDNSYIRTMEKDLAVLQGKGPVKSVLPTGDSTEKRSVGKLVPPKPPTESFRKATPPAGLPVLESVKGPETSLDALSVPRPTESIIPPKSPERIIKEEEIKNRIKETQRRIEEARRKAEMARQKAAREEAEKKETPRKIETAKKKKPSLSFVFIGLAAIVVIGGLGGFVYWWNYLRVITPVFHYECQDNLCQRVEKKGEDQCQIDADCQLMPVEPTVPASLMPVAEIKTIELTAGQEDLLLEELKTAASQEQAANTFKQILVKIVGPEEKKYASLNSLSNALGISLPENILLAVAASETEGDNYTLFLYNQTEGNRLGLVVKMAQSETLVADLKNWEATMTGGLKSLFLENEAPAAFTEGFQDNIYQDIVIRYLNFPDPGLSIDYGIVTGKLILTTSRESMYAAIDALLTVETAEAETEIDISNWQTYRNEEYGFEIKYPEGWYLNDQSSIMLLSNYENARSFDLGNVPDDMESIFIETKIVEPDLALDDFRPSSDEIIQLIKFEKFVTNQGLEGRKIVLYFNDHPTGYHTRIFFLGSDGGKITFSLGVMSEDIQDIFNQILATFATIDALSAPESENEAQDCNANFDCFIASAENCRPAKVTNIATTSIFEVEQTTTSYFEIKGLEADKCVFYLRTEKIDLAFPPETPQDIINQQGEVYKKLEGKDGICEFNIDDLTAMLKRWKAGVFSSEDWDVAECQGTYFNQ